ncbi:hypothetical protein [Salinivibrio phage CW02]|uniref:Uncharacterized protein n=1 Tax=Salinivibrio phage CW02 TaxID=1161935 RepID=H9D1E6_9CAUD|nr:hypothetical protein F490_gp49 [Salinivibrio phage CW02]AFE86188.1 hypothetical protein [Salinivibrio phage CW02]
MPKFRKGMVLKVGDSPTVLILVLGFEDQMYKIEKIRTNFPGELGRVVEVSRLVVEDLCTPCFIPENN